MTSQDDKQTDGELRDAFRLAVDQAEQSVDVGALLVKFIAKPDHEPFGWLRSMIPENRLRLTLGVTAAACAVITVTGIAYFSSGDAPLSSTDNQEIAAGKKQTANAFGDSESVEGRSGSDSGNRDQVDYSDPDNGDRQSAVPTGVDDRQAPSDERNNLTNPDGPELRRFDDDLGPLSGDSSSSSAENQTKELADLIFPDDISSRFGSTDPVSPSSANLTDSILETSRTTLDPSIRKMTSSTRSRSTTVTDSSTTRPTISFVTSGGPTTTIRRTTTTRRPTTTTRKTTTRQTTTTERRTTTTRRITTTKPITTTEPTTTTWLTTTTNPTTTTEQTTTTAPTTTSASTTTTGPATTICSFEVTGGSLDEAKGTIRSAGCTGTISLVPEDAIGSLAYIVGGDSQTIDKNEPITLIGYSTIPDLDGMSASEAESALKAASFVPIAESEIVPDDDPRIGQTISQSPRPHTRQVAKSFAYYTIAEADTSE